MELPGAPWRPVEPTEVNSNQKGGGGTANFRKALSALRSAVPWSWQDSMMAVIGGWKDVDMMLYDVILVGGDWNMTGLFSHSAGNNHPNWLIFFRWVETTNQYSYILLQLVLLSIIATVIQVYYNLYNIANWKDPSFSMGRRSTISMVIFNSYVSQYQRVDIATAIVTVIIIVDIHLECYLIWVRISLIFGKTDIDGWHRKKRKWYSKHICYRDILRM